MLFFSPRLWVRGCESFSTKVHLGELGAHCECVIHFKYIFHWVTKNKLIVWRKSRVPKQLRAAFLQANDNTQFRSFYSLDSMRYCVFCVKLESYTLVWTYSSNQIIKFKMPMWSKTLFFCSSVSHAIPHIVNKKKRGHCARTVYKRSMWCENYRSL